MKVFNLTDVHTKTLEQHGLLNRHIAVGRRMVDPGEYVTVEDDAAMRARIEPFVRLGALCVDALPPPYLQAKQAIQSEARSTFGGIPVRHVEMHETVTAGEPVAPLPDQQGAPPVLEKYVHAQAPEPIKPETKPSKKKGQSR